jgi:pyridoxamine 5'-phosphate oxidase
MNLAELRIDYEAPPLRETDLDADPVRQFQQWLAAALAAGLAEPHAMTLATATPDGVPSARVVLLRGCDERGFAFYTNFDSRKGRELAANPRAALVFYWHPLHRQVRVEGTVERVADAEADDYFRSRPRGSQVGAWASPQSEVIAGRELLEQRLAAVLAQYPDGPLPRPPFWGGYRVRPTALEFWQGQPSRLHDRFRYTLLGDGTWRRERLGP